VIYNTKDGVSSYDPKLIWNISYSLRTTTLDVYDQAAGYVMVDVLIISVRHDEVYCKCLKVT